MGNFEIDYAFMMRNEDQAQAHAIVADAPPGAHAISGINSAAFPADFAKIAAIPQAQRGVAVEQFYFSHFWDKWFAGITSDDVAERIFDTTVNIGMGRAVKIAQSAVNSLGENINVDGAWGPATLNAINSCDPQALVQAFDNARVAHYEENDGNSPYLAQLLARARE